MEKAKVSDATKQELINQASEGIAFLMVFRVSGLGAENPARVRKTVALTSLLCRACEAAGIQAQEVIDPAIKKAAEMLKGLGMEGCGEPDCPNCGGDELARVKRIGSGTVH